MSKPMNRPNKTALSFALIALLCLFGGCRHGQQQARIEPRPQRIGAHRSADRARAPRRLGDRAHHAPRSDQPLYGLAPSERASDQHSGPAACRRSGSARSIRQDFWGRWNRGAWRTTTKRPPTGTPADRHHRSHPHRRKGRPLPPHPADAKRHGRGRPSRKHRYKRW